MLKKQQNIVYNWHSSGMVVNDINSYPWAWWFSFRVRQQAPCYLEGEVKINVKKKQYIIYLDM